MKLKKRWNLNDLVCEGDIENKINLIDKKTSKFETHRKKLSKITKKEFYNILKEYEELLKEIIRLEVYVGLKFSENSSNDKILALKNKVENFSTAISNRILFFNIWWKDLEDDKAKKFIEKGPYEYYLKRARVFKKYILSEKEEKIINLKDLNGSEALSTLYEIITTNFIFEFKGKKLTRSQLIEYVKSNDQKLRKLSYDVLLNKYKNHKGMIGEIFKNYIMDWYNETILLRGYKDPLDSSIIGKDLPREAVEVLFRVVRKNKKTFQRYFILKAKILGMKKLRRYDIYAPYKEDKRKTKYGLAVKEILEVFMKFDPEFAELAKKVFVESHVDVETKKGKNDGAFCCSSLPEIVPYVLLNYIGKTRDKSTIAHELGHAIHSMMAKERSVLNFHATTPLAETASNFTEQLFFEHLVSEERNKENKKSLLIDYLGDSYASIVRQLYFSLFEKEVIELVRKGATIEDINKIWIKTLKEQFGDSVEVPEIFKYEWMYIGHFYSPFYCYSYSFGALLVLALYEEWKREGDKFIPKYKKILSYGGSKAPYNILKEAGFDINKESFWQSGFDYIEGLIDELEGLCN